MNFCEALEVMKTGKRVTRTAWGSSQMAVYLIENRMNNISHLEFRSKTHSIMYAASSADILANDWAILAPTKIKGLL